MFFLIFFLFLLFPTIILLLISKERFVLTVWEGNIFQCFISNLAILCMCTLNYTIICKSHMHDICIYITYVQAKTHYVTESACLLSYRQVYPCCQKWWQLLDFNSELQWVGVWNNILTFNKAGIKNSKLKSRQWTV